MSQTCEEEQLRGKLNRQIEQFRKEASQEKSVRVKIEESHKTMFDRVQDLEKAIEIERRKVNE